MFARSRTDRQFGRFCRTGDPAALAAVFDRTAGELRRVAGHLCRDANAADDLVQETFLVAIETRARFDPARPVLPWLLGVLANLARRRRLLPSADLAAVEPSARAADPARLAAARELAAVVERRLRALPEPYRSTLRRHLEDGVPAHAIAAERGVLAATVRSQVMRGMDMLRRDLPRGLAVAAPWTAPTAAGLAAVRAGVLRRAHALADAAPVASSPLLLGSLAMKKPLLAGAGCVLAVLFAWATTAVWSARDPASRTPAGDATASEALAAAAQTPPPAVHAEREGGLQTPAPARETVPASGAATGSLVVRARFASDAAPAVGLGVYVRTSGGGGGAGDSRGREQRAGADGVVRFDDLEPGPYLVLTDRCRGSRAHVEPGRTAEVELEIPPGILVAGTVVDVAGTVVGGARVFAKRREHDAFFQSVTVADANGRFALRDVEPGTQLLARADGYQPSHHTRSGSVSGAPGNAQTVTLRLGARAHRLRGEVVGADGGPVPHALVAIAVDEDARKHVDGVLAPKYASELTRPLDLEEFVLRCDAGGRFDVREVPMGNVLVLARARDGRPAPLAWAQIRVVPHTDNHVRLQLGPGAVVEGEVHDESGRPIAGLDVVSEWKGTLALGNLEHHLGHLVAAGRATTDAEGRFRLAGLLPGEHELVLGGGFGEDLRLDSEGAYQERIVLADQQVLQWRARVPRRVPLRLRLLGPDGQPLAGWGVHAAPEPGATTGRARLRRTRTDGEGRTTLPRVPEGPLVVSLHAPWPETDPDEMPAHVEQAVQGGNDEVTIRVPALPTAELRGRLVGAARTLDLRSATTRVTRSTTPAAGTRAFTFGALPAGTYWLAPHGGGVPAGAFGPFTLAAGQQVDAGELRIPEPRVALLHAAGGVLPQGARADVHASREVHACKREGDALRTPALFPGRFVAFLHGGGVVPTAVAVELDASPQTMVPVELPEGSPVRFELVAASPLVASEVDLDLFLSAHGETGLVHRGKQATSQGADLHRRTFELVLGPGSYRLRAEVPGRQRVYVDFELAESTREVVRIALD